MAEGSKAKFIRDALDRVIEQRVPQVSPEEFERMFSLSLTPAEIRDLTFGELMIRQMVLKACSGNDKSISEVLDRLLGKPMQTTESVSKSYSYHDLLIQLKEQDEAEKKVMDIIPTRQMQQATTKQIVDLIGEDILADLL